MALSSELNSSYRPSSALVTEKYTPLLEIKLEKSDTKLIQEIVQNRIEVFADMDVKVDRLTYLAIESLEHYAELEVGKNPPMVVVSSNRSGWIKNGYDKANRILESIFPSEPSFKTVTDPRVLKEGPVPFYLPIRMTPEEASTRNVYLFVANDEYYTYYKAFKDTNITVIGWRTEGTLRLTGFGGSRYAALEFFKLLLSKYKVCSSIWMLDDNVSYIRNFPGLAAVEGQLGTLFGLGFNGGTQVIAESKFIEMAKLPAPTPVAANLHSEAPILQQAVLWSVAQFLKADLSFSPYFITSAEDTSLTKFLGLKNCKYYSGCKILKGETYPDQSIGVEVLQETKNILLNCCYQAKYDVPFSCAVVPQAKTLSTVITEARDAATSPPKIVNVADEENLQQTYSKAVEQILSMALTKNIALPERLFKPPGLWIASKLMPKS